MSKEPSENSFAAMIRRTLQSLRQPVIATIMGLLVGAVVILSCGENPLTVYAEMFEKSFFKPYYLFSTLTRATPIILCAMATAIAWRAGWCSCARRRCGACSGGRGSGWRAIGSTA